MNLYASDKKADQSRRRGSSSDYADSQRADVMAHVRKTPEASILHQYTDGFDEGFR